MGSRGIWHEGVVPLEISKEKPGNCSIGMWYQGKYAYIHTWLNGLQGFVSAPEGGLFQE